MLENCFPILNISCRFSSEYTSPEGFECRGTHSIPNISASILKASLNASKSIPSSIKGIVSKLNDDIEFMDRKRLSKLTYSGHKKISRINRKTAIIAFSTEEVYAIAELIRRQKGGAAIVMGSLSPKTRNAQVDLYQSGDVDFLVATDAIGMGINMDLDQVYFSNLKKFDGKN